MNYSKGKLTELLINTKSKISNLLSYTNQYYEVDVSNKCITVLSEDIDFKSLLSLLFSNNDLPVGVPYILIWSNNTKIGVLTRLSDSEVQLVASQSCLSTGEVLHE